MGGAAIEPHVEDVGDPLVIVGVVVGPEECLRAFRADQASTPCAFTAATIRALTAGSTRYSPVSRSTNSVIGTPQARWRLEHPVGPPLDHRADAVAALSGTKRGRSRPARPRAASRRVRARRPRRPTAGARGPRPARPHGACPSARTTAACSGRSPWPSSATNAGRSACSPRTPRAARRLRAGPSRSARRAR